VDQLHVGQQATNSHTCKRNSGGVCGQGLSARGHFITPAVQPGWMNSQTGSMRMAAIHWGMQIIALSLLAENFQTLSSWSFFRGLPVWYNSGVIGLSCHSTKDGDSSIHKEERFKRPNETSPLWT